MINFHVDSVDLSIYRPKHPLVYLSIYLYVCLFIYLSICLSVCVSTYRPVYLSIYLSSFFLKRAILLLFILKMNSCINKSSNLLQAETPPTSTIRTNKNKHNSTEVLLGFLQPEFQNHWSALCCYNTSHDTPAGVTMTIIYNPSKI